MQLRAAIAGLLALLVAAPETLAAGTCLRGINLAGAEFGEVGGMHGQAYAYPSQQTISYFAEKGFTSVRLPFLWERLQPKLDAPFDQAELERLTETVSSMRALGLKVVLDPHNYARYRGQLIGSKAVPVSSFVDFWVRLSAQFKSDPSVIFALMNEPHGISAKDWVDAANAATSAIRKHAAQNLILVPGTAWTGAHSWFGDWYGGANAEALGRFRDPANRSAIEIHQYSDKDFSGTNRDCSRGAEAVSAVAKLSQWLRDSGKRGFLGEFGVPADPACIASAKEMVSMVEKNADVWLGWAYWAAGDWWPEDEMLNIQPRGGKNRPQFAALAEALNGPIDSKACAGLLK